MGTSDDSMDEMSWLPFDDGLDDSILDGSLRPDDAPAGLQEIASLVQSARRSALPEELAGEDALVARMAAVAGSPERELAADPLAEGAGVSTDAERGRAVVLKRLRLEKIVPATVAILLAGSAAAAAAGTFHGAAAPSVAMGKPLSITRVVSAPKPAAALAKAHRAKAHHAAASVPSGSAQFEASLSSSSSAATGHKDHTPRAFGVVASVNGTATAGTCGTAATAGSFTLAVGWWGWDGHAGTFQPDHSGHTLTVDVTTSTAYVDPATTSPSFADVCVGDHAGVAGSDSDGTIAASEVYVATPVSRAEGTVSAVDGSTAAGTCGVAAAAGSFVIGTASTQPAADKSGGHGSGWSGWGDGGSSSPVTVDVTAATTFVEPGNSSASFADVCVGSQVGAAGTSSSSGVLSAASVYVQPSRAFGIVTSVNGTTTAGTCGTAGGTGTFIVLQGGDAHGWLPDDGQGGSATPVTVDVTSSTTFYTPGKSSASFADVCVGSFAAATGSSSSGALDASTVFVLPAKSGSGGGGGGGGPGHGGPGNGGPGNGGPGNGGPGNGGDPHSHHGHSGGGGGQGGGGGGGTGGGGGSGSGGQGGGWR
jgi:hypothetical protein